MENRKLVSWRLEKLDKKQQDTINSWLDAQQNIQLSLTNIVQHMIDRYGITDIMNYDVQKSLYTNPDAVIIDKQKENKVETIQKETLNSQAPEITLTHTDSSSDDLYSALGDDV